MFKHGKHGILWHRANVRTVRRSRRLLMEVQRDCRGQRGDGLDPRGARRDADRQPARAAQGAAPLACTNAIENMQGTIRRVSRNVKRWQHAEMALRRAAAGMMEAAKGFRRLKAYRQLPSLRAALDAHASRHRQGCAVALDRKAA